MGNFLQAYYPYIITAIQALFFLAAMVLSAKFVPRKDCQQCRVQCGKDKDKLSGEVDELEKRVTRNEDKLGNLPKGDEVAALREAMAELSGELKVLAERIEGVKEAQNSTKELATRLDNFLRNKKG